jgi:hypothetical protein
VQRGTNGETLLKLDREAQEHAGLKMAILEAAQSKQELKAFGRIVDAATLATAHNEIAMARAQVEASAREAQRLKMLFGQNQNASARALEAAEAMLKRDQLALQAAELRLLTSWGPSIAGRTNLEALISLFVSQEAALARVDVPASEKIEGTPTAARLALLSAQETPMEAELLGSAPAADPQTLGRGFLFLVKARALPANAAVVAWLSMPGEAAQGVIVPRDAIVRHAGEAFIYVQTADEMFARQGVELEHPLERGWFTEGLKPGVKVVLTGAQQLLSEELKGKGGEE